jgi:hypothetical protein
MVEAFSRNAHSQQPESDSGYLFELVHLTHPRLPELDEHDSSSGEQEP